MAGPVAGATTALATLGGTTTALKAAICTPATTATGIGALAATTLTAATLAITLSGLIARALVIPVGVIMMRTLTACLASVFAPATAKSATAATRAVVRPDLVTPATLALVAVFVLLTFFDVFFNISRTFICDIPGGFCDPVDLG